MRDDFAVFILTHGRAKQQKTLETLVRCGYTGRTYLIIDDEDEQKQLYHDLLGINVIEFNKREIEKSFDTMTNAKIYGSVVYARNAVYDIAKQYSIKYIFTFDDDITDLNYRVVKGGKLKGIKIKKLDRLFTDMVDYMESAPITMLGFSQCGAFIGGAGNKKYWEGCHHNMSQAMLVKADDPVTFRGIFNEDFHASLDMANHGRVALATMLVSIISPQRMTNSGGLHDLYKSSSTYARDFYSKMLYPSVVELAVKGHEIKSRMNHKAFGAKILNEKYRKAATENA